ncbi:FxDxF family PEP-CTERM protein [Herbaspirillum sp. YR522]|uniref:FxDxF family PEP-CTERM protein n=1 Tax=Herbaspirillum sp. YR522 TaxID=1144342 RepID=UPI00026F6E39|nr:FxDxF family PEP-CTERM protein [Herbaspirillum sp. YR522]EJM98618.1 PEP-CTERM putative exosortase interaction domain-containing protein [Herbaspirillum sp. YR522]
MKKIFAGMFLALSFLAAGASANAADINHTSTLVFNSGQTTKIGADYSSSSLPGGGVIKGKTFSETFNFVVSQNFDVSSAVISIALSNISALDISKFALTSANGTNILGTKTTVGSTQFFNLNASSLAAGSYTLTVLGKITGSTGGSFGGNISISAVPEATTTAMMLAGLAIVGFGAYRRRRQDAGRVNLGNVAMA